MRKWTIRDNGMIAQAKQAAFAPKTIITLLLGVAIYAVYMYFSVNAGLIYSVVYMAVQGDLLAGLQLVESQPFFAFALMVTVVLIVLTVVYVRLIEKRSAASMGLSRGRWPRRYAGGYLLGLLLLGVSTLPWLLTEDIVVRGFTVLVIAFFVAFVVQSASEEIFFRGFLMPSVGAKMGVFWGVMISTVLFALGHIFNPGQTIIGLFAIFFIGLFLALFILRTGSIIGACAIHAAWNFGTGLITAINIGSYTIDYAVVQVGEVVPIGDAGILGDPIDFYYIGVFVIAICVLLFAGKGRLVVRAETAEDDADGEMQAARGDIGG